VTLHEILPRVRVMLGDIGCDHVSIARGQRLIEIRFAPDNDAIVAWGQDDRAKVRIDARLWMDGTEATPTRGTSKGYVGWALWSRFGGFSVADVLASDWRIAP
jgi:hypothetical protein